MKRLLVLFFSIPFITLAQISHLVVEGSSPALYLMHTVQAKENYYSIGRLYNVSPKEIAPFNSLQIEKGLSLHQIIKVPLTANNFLQSGNAAADEVLVPVYHILQPKEGLYRVGVTYNKLPLETLKKWNNIKGESAPNGTNLIVGYLKVKKELSALSAIAKTKAYDNTVTSAVTVVDAAPAPKKEVAVVPKAKQPIFIEDNPAKEPEVVAPKKTKPLVKEIEPQKQPEKQPEKQQEKVVAKNFNGGLFKRDYDVQSKRSTAVNEAGPAATFKSNSGWEDGKYYCLHNAAPSGTILKITNVVTGKMVYAKVLDVMPDIKQNGGLLVRLSNAAAQELGVSDARFDCSVSYTK